MKKQQVLEKGPQNGRRRVSLKWKWTIGAALAIFLTYTIFASLIYFGFRQIFLENEMQNLRETTTEITERLMDEPTSLTSRDVERALSPRRYIISSGRSNGNVPIGEGEYTDSLYAQITQPGISVSIYNEEADLVYESGMNTIPFHPRNSYQLNSIEGENGLSLSAQGPVHSTVNDQLTGYVHVTDNLLGYHQLIRRISIAIVLTGILALVLSAILGYLLAYNFLKPIRQITAAMNTIRQEPLSEVRINVRGGNDELTELANAYNEMLDRMQRNIEQQKQFVEDVSHELRTPVAVVEGHMKLLNRWGKDDPEILEESLRASLQEMERMKSLVQEMLDLSRAEQVEIHYRNERTSVLEVVEQTHNNFQMIHPDFVFILDKDLDESVYVSMYRNHLEQVLVILMDNAVKYSADRKEVHLSVSTSLNEVELAVQDFGVGMTNEEAEKIFERFYRVDKARSRNQGGNGLGLSIARELIQGYGGKIWVESVLNYGSIFRIVLPILQEDSEEEND